MRVIWALLAALGIGLAIAGLASWRWAAAENSADVVAGAGLYLSVLGIYGTLVGFILAFEQIRKSISASEASEKTLTEIKAKLSSLSASGEIERARFALEEAERSLHANRHKELKFGLSPARQSFVRIVELDLDIFSDLKPQLSASIVEMAGILDRTDEVDKDFQRTVGGLIRTYSDIASQMQVRMSRG